MTEITPSPQKKRKLENDLKDESSPDIKRRKKSRLERIGPYIVLDFIGQGGYGTIFRAKEEKSGKIVAIKKISIKEETNAMEIKILTELSKHCSEYFLCLVEILRDDDYLYIVTEYLGNYIRLADFLFVDEYKRPTDNLIELEQRFPERIALENKILCNLAKGIEILHSKFIAHVDLTTENILVNPKTGQVKIIDFGISEMGKNVHEHYFDEDHNDLMERAFQIIGEIEPNEETPMLNERNNLWESGFVGADISKFKKYICKE